MKIEKIVLRNLTAIEGEQIIDFTVEPLRSAGLFAITGDTGSGKSTLLDAICLALYNKAPRFENVEKIAADDLKLTLTKAQQMQASCVSAILRRGKKEGNAQVIFSTHDGARYEATWSIRVARTGTYKTPERTFRQLAPQKQKFDKNELQEAINQTVGLSYEQFTRTVILAQNSFANFLKAKVADKAVLLEKLTGTEVYGSVSEQIYRLTAEAENQVSALENQMHGMLHDRMEPQELEAAEEKRKILTATRDHLQQQSAVISRQLDWIERHAAARQLVSNEEARYAAATKACMEMRADEARLERHDSLLGMQPIFQEITMRRTDIGGMKEDENRLASALETVRKTLETKQQQLARAEEQTAEAEHRYELRAEAINRGHALTGEMKVAAEQLKRAEEQLLQGNNTLENRENAFRAKQEALEAATAEIGKKQLHKQSLSVHRLMFDKFDLIKDKLSLFYTETHRNAESHRKQTDLQKRKQELLTQSEKAEQEQNRNQARMNSLKSSLMIHKQTNQGLDSAKLQKTAAETRSRLAALERAAVLWRHISEGYSRLSEGRAVQKREETELARKRQLTQRLEIEREAAEEAFGRIATAYTLSQSENIVELRKQLKEGNACPVCGATHHPYHTETERELGKLLSNLSSEYTAAQTALEQKRNALAALREDIAADDARIKAAARALKTIEERQTADVEEWQSFAYLDNSFRDCSETVNREARALMIQLLKDNTLRAADAADKELENYNFHQQQINELNEQIASLDTLMADNHTYLDKLRTEAQISAAAAEELQQVINLSDRACSQLYTDLDEMITVSGWFTEWKNNADGLRLRLTNLHHDWNATCRALEETERSVDLLREEIKGASANVEEARRSLVSLRETRDAVREALENKKEEMRHLFGESTPQRETELLRGAIQTARLREVELRKGCEAEQGMLKSLEGKRENLEKNRTDAQKQLQEKQQQLDLMILRFNGSHPPVQFAELETLFTGVQDWKTLRTKLDERKSERTLAENRLTQARDVLLKLQADPARPKEDPQHTETALRQALDEGKVTLARTMEELGVCQSRLLSHENCVKRAERLMGELDQAKENATQWNRLNSLFGSADGKKFRTLAQSITFGCLVDHANYHLRQLSPRYELCNLPGTLTLEIVDRDMLDEHRYVTSLSGGETFVVSLALALGLASLSGPGLAIGSLFIDEGFGNLDRDSLNLVMAALSNLENAQGRKVGVISHTEQIRSQISPQIILRKQPGSGASVIEVK